MFCWLETLLGNEGKVVALGFEDKNDEEWAKKVKELRDSSYFLSRTLSLGLKTDSSGVLFVKII